MNPGLIFLLIRWLWTPKPTREVVGLPRSIAERMQASLDALSGHTSPEMLDEIGQDARELLRESLAERGVPEGAYALELGSDPPLTARVVRPQDGCSWTLAEFDEFIDLGLHPRGSPG
jgi:hypothetical protein